MGFREENRREWDCSLSWMQLISGSLLAHLVSLLSTPLPLHSLPLPPSFSLRTPPCFGSSPEHPCCCCCYKYLRGPVEQQKGGAGDRTGRSQEIWCIEDNKMRTCVGGGAKTGRLDRLKGIISSCCQSSSKLKEYLKATAPGLYPPQVWKPDLDNILFCFFGTQTDWFPAEMWAGKGWGGAEMSCSCVAGGAWGLRRWSWTAGGWTTVF